jgi:hypothetical protein
MASQSAKKAAKSVSPTNETTQTQQASINPAAQPFLNYAGAQTQNLMQSPQPYYPGQTYVSPSGMTQQGVAQLGQQAGLLNQSVPYYQQAAKTANSGVPYYQTSADAYAQSADQMGGYLGQQQQNYGMLSNAADVANNPYVQQQLAANRQQVGQAFKEDWLPAINQGAQQVNALGSSRQGIAQAQGMERASQQLANTNASTMLNAYGQGLNAQQGALNQTGNMLNNLTMPGQAMGQAGAQLGNAATLQGQAGGYMQTGATAQGNAAAANMLGGQTVEAYQNAALQDQISRYNWMFQEPQQRIQMATNMASAYQPYGTQTSTGTAPNPNYMTQQQAGLYGAGAGLNTGIQVGGLLADAWQKYRTPATTAAK